MEYLINSIAEIRNKQADESKVLYSGNKMTVQCFRLRKGSSVMEDNDDPSYDGLENRTICYIVERGSAEYWLGEEKVVVPSGGCITVTPKENFSMWALEDCFIIAIYNHEEPDIDNSPVELVEAVKKVELRDRYLQGHNYRVGKYSMLMMQIICPNKANYQYYFSAAYHDVGKVVVPEEVLNKPGNLTDGEYDLIKEHPEASYEMLKGYLGDNRAKYARWHHEKIDGSGYPDGIKGDEIPLESRIMAVADIFDALTTARCYRKAFSFEDALEIMKGDVEKGKIDGEVFEVLKKLVKEGKLVEGVDNQLFPLLDKENV